MRRGGQTILDLTISNPTVCGIEYPEKELIASLAQAQSLRYVPSSKGLISARGAIAGYYRQKNIQTDPDQIILTASTSEAYSTVFRLLCEVRDEVLVPVPSYPLFEFLAQLNDVVVKPYYLRYDGEWHIDMASVTQSVSERTKAIIIINPHNPTGMFLKKSALALLSVIAEQHGLSLIVDEVFANYAFGDDRARVSSTANHSDALTFTLNGISKLAGLPQMKLGWIVVSGPAEEKREAIDRLEIIADTYLSVNTPVQVALPQLLEHGAMIRSSIRHRTSQNLKTLRRLVSNGSKCTLFQNEGGWYGILQVPRTRTGEEWALNLLREMNVYIHPGYFFDFEQDNVLVLSLLPEAKQFEEGARRIVEYVARN
jgi:alanine-synthesizing transaminase